MGAPGAFADAAALASRLARWRVCYGSRPLFRAAAGPRWVRLHLAGDEHFCLLLTTVPGATQLVGLHGRLPEALTTALPAERDHPLPAALAGTTLTGLAALPNERVACLRFTRPDGSPLHLLHQLFGSPGNTVLLDGGGRCLWAAHRPPNALLAVAPGRSLYAEAARATDAPDVGGLPGVESAEIDEAESNAALEHLSSTLAEELHGRATVALDRRLRAASRLCERRTADLAGAGAGDEHRRRAEALAASLHTIRQGASSCEVTDPRDGARVTIELDPAQGPAANLAALFHRARKADRGREVIAAKLSEAQAEMDALRSALGGLAALPTGTGGLQRLAALQEWLAGRFDLARDGGSRAGAARRSGAEEEP